MIWQEYTPYEVITPSQSSKLSVTTKLSRHWLHFLCHTSHPPDLLCNLKFVILSPLHLFCPSPAPLPLTTISLFSVPTSFSGFWTPHVTEIVFVLLWLISLGIIPSKSIRVIHVYHSKTTSSLLFYIIFQYSSIYFLALYSSSLVCIKPGIFT